MSGAARSYIAHRAHLLAILVWQQASEMFSGSLGASWLWCIRWSAGFVRVATSRTLLPASHTRRLRDNPVPLEFPISFIGSKPTVQLILQGAVSTTLGARGAADDGATTARSNDSPGAAVPPALQAAATPPGAATRRGKPNAREGLLVGVEHQVVFERQLVGKTEVKRFTIANPGLLPFKWRLAGVEALPSEFKVGRASGYAPIAASHCRHLACTKSCIAGAAQEHVGSHDSQYAATISCLACR